jgi:hypothetical protein
MDFSVIKTTCNLPESYANVSYHDTMRELNPNFNFGDFITPFHNAEILYAWVRTTTGVLTKVNYYFVDPSALDFVLSQFTNAVQELTPTVTVEKAVMTQEEILDKFLNHDTLHVRQFSKIRNLFN